MIQDSQEQILLLRTMEIVSEVSTQRINRNSNAMMPDDERSDLEKEMEKHYKDAEAISKSRAFKSALCAGMKSASSNLKSIATIVVTTLITLANTGTIALPITPMISAATVLLVLDVGISTYCHDIKD